MGSNLETTQIVPPLLRLPPELLGFISVYCFAEFRTTCKFMKQVAYPWLTVKTSQGQTVDISARARTQANCYILDLPLNENWIVGKSRKSIDCAFLKACKENNIELAKLYWSSRYKIFLTVCSTIDQYFGLYYAEFNENKEIIKMCTIDDPIDCFYYYRKPECMFYYACEENNLEMVMWCIENTDWSSINLEVLIERLFVLNFKCYKKNFSLDPHSIYEILLNNACKNNCIEKIKYIHSKSLQLQYCCNKHKYIFEPKSVFRLIEKLSLKLTYLMTYKDY